MWARNRQVCSVIFVYSPHRLPPGNSCMPLNDIYLPIVVYGASGHTGRFIVAELVRKGFTPVLSGRDRDKLAAVSALHGGLEVRAASLDDPMALGRALAGSAAVIHAAGPFAISASPMVDAAIRAQ